MTPDKVKHYKTKEIFDEVEPIISGRLMAVMQSGGKCDVQYTGNLTKQEEKELEKIIRKNEYYF